jgi:hypothetical protein
MKRLKFYPKIVIPSKWKFQKMNTRYSENEVYKDVTYEVKKLRKKVLNSLLLFL